MAGCDVVTGCDAGAAGVVARLVAALRCDATTAPTNPATTVTETTSVAAACWSAAGRIVRMMLDARANAAPAWPPAMAEEVTCARGTFARDATAIAPTVD